MRENILCGMERSELMSRQFGLHRFNSEDEAWWPSVMRNSKGDAKPTEKKGGTSAREISSDTG